MNIGGHDWLGAGKRLQIRSYLPTLTNIDSTMAIGSASASGASRGGCSWAPSTTMVRRFSTPFAVASAAARAGYVISPVQPIRGVR